MVSGVLIERIRRTQAVESFRFKPDKKIDFLPGQFLQLIFDQKDQNNLSLNKYLSFSSAPGNDYIEVTKRMSESEFSDSLRKLAPGDRVLFKAPMGNCVFKDQYSKIGFLIGGIGITPVISILEYIVAKSLDTDVCLLYSNRTEADIAFKPEIDAWSASNSQIKVTYLVSHCEPSDQRCFSGVIDQQFVTSQVCDPAQRNFFIFGPPKMVASMKNICLGIGCDEEMVKVENFIGY